METFVNINKKDSKLRIKIKDMLDRYKILSPKYQSKIGYDTLIQNNILKELINIMATTIINLDIKLKMKISRIEDLESKTNSQTIKKCGNHLYSKSCGDS